MQGRQELRQLPANLVRVHRIDDLEQGRSGHEPGDQEQRIGTADDDLGQDRNRRCARQRGQNPALPRQAKHGRTRPCELHHKLATGDRTGLAPQRVTPPVGAGTVTGYPLSCGAAPRNASLSASTERSASHLTSDVPPRHDRRTSARGYQTAYSLPPGAWALGGSCAPRPTFGTWGVEPTGDACCSWKVGGPRVRERSWPLPAGMAEGRPVA